MLTLIIGGSGSGKSAYAEKYVALLSERKQRYYLATMQVFDKEGQAKIDRHRVLRRGKGFITIEQPCSIQEALGKISDTKESVALLECMSNLVANEMFSEDGFQCGDKITDKIIDGIRVLRAELTQLVIVTNNVFEDGISYDETTMEYIRAMGSINQRLAAMADNVIEVVVGIPVVVKGQM